MYIDEKFSLMNKLRKYAWLVQVLGLLDASSPFIIPANTSQTIYKPLV